jgi:Tol biopolymer transport system component
VFLANSVSYQLEAADPDGSNVTVLAAFPQDAFGDEMFANWSPDGGTVLLNIYNAVWEVGADGAELHELISCKSPGVHCGRHGGFGPATFTPDGEHILVEHCCTDPEGLYRLDADGSGLTPIRLGDFGNPQVSPDGQTIAFRVCDIPTPGCAVGTMSITGRHVRLLTDGSVNWDFPNWAPDSKRIVISGFNGGSANIAIMRADGSHFRQLTADPKTYSVWGCFSPDGKKILFSRFRSTGWWDLYTMKPDGTRVSQASRTADAEFWPQWAAR